ncbi:MAG: hypothetical protein HDT39_02230 [Lachnospiraceae bacterium]|nr:hypothetical protein [Lachnospiraceae bacterium]
MKTNIIYRQIRRISMINLIIPVILSVILVIFYFHIPFEDMLSPVHLESADQSDSFYSKNIRFVNISFSKLYYTGYDCIKNGSISGYYYYSLDNGKCTFVLVDSKRISKPDEVIKGYSMDASLEKHNHLIDQMISSFSKDLKWTKDGLSAASSISYINETGFNSSLYLFLGICLFILSTLFLSYIIINILYIIAPGICPPCIKFKKMSGDIKRLIRVDNELKKSVCMKTGNTTITNHYLVYMSNLNVEIVPLNKIDYINIHISHHNFPHTAHKYTISFHCKYKVRISLNHISETDFNAITDYLKTLNLNIKKKE